MSGLQVIAANLQTLKGKQIRSEQGAIAQAKGRAAKGKERPTQVANFNEKIALLTEMKERSLPEFEEFLEGTMSQFKGEKLALKQ